MAIAPRPGTGIEAPTARQGAVQHSKVRPIGRGTWKPTGLSLQALSQLRLRTLSECRLTYYSERNEQEKAIAMEPREIVKADNAFFRVRCKVKNVIATRIVMAFASLVDESDLNENKRFLKYKIDASSIFDGIDAGGNYYNQLREAAYTLIDQKLEQRKHKNHFKVYTLFSTIEYENGSITGEFHSDLLPFFLGLKKQFTRMSLSQYLKLPSIYSQKLFGYLTSWAGTPEVEISVLDLHEMLDTPESLRKNFTELRRWVLEKAHKDITGLTPLRYEWEPVKKGRAVVAVRFIFSRRRALPVSTAKSVEDEEKRCRLVNQRFLRALECAKAKGGDCRTMDNVRIVCKLCREQEILAIARRAQPCHSEKANRSIPSSSPVWNVSSHSQQR